MIVFPYVKWRGKLCPIVSVELSNKGKKIYTQAYLDTGATYSVFNADFADRLGLRLEDGKRVRFVIGDGGSIPVYLHEVGVGVDDLSFQGTVGFSSKLGTGINILGRVTVMDRFMICFDGRNRKVIWHAK